MTNNIAQLLIFTEFASGAESRAAFISHLSNNVHGIWVFHLRQLEDRINDGFISEYDIPNE